MKTQKITGCGKIGLKCTFAWIFILFLQLSVAFGQKDTLRIMTYNLLNFPSAQGAARLPDFRMILRQINPDIVVVQELETATGLQTFLNNVMNPIRPATYMAGPFINGPDTDSGILYDRNKVKLLGAKNYPTTLRDIVEYRMQANHVNFNIYSVHLKAGSTDSDLNQRLSETGTLRRQLNQLAAGANFLVAGDFNMAGISEPGFQELTGSQTDNDGQLFDPINAVGTWHNNPLFAKIHTQSTRVASFNGGSTGGLDDRFDMMLVSQSLLQENQMWIIRDSYTAFGNDGRHFNKAINDGRNFVVADSIADALHQASDHLPAYADFVIQTTTRVPGTRHEIPRRFSLQPNFPNPFNSSTWVQYTLPVRTHLTLALFNPAGVRVAVLLDATQAAGNHRIKFEASSLPSGLYILQARAGQWVQQQKLILLK